jgi:hypothetical protein
MIPLVDNAAGDWVRMHVSDAGQRLVGDRG